MPAKNTESFLELEGLQEHLELTEKAIERANLFLESIEISINERESEPPTEAGSKYAPSLPFESTSGHSSPSRASESKRRARVLDLQVEQAKREAQRRLEEERKRAENLEQERQLQEHRRIRKLEYEVERLRLEAQLDIPDKIKEIQKILRTVCETLKMPKLKLFTATLNPKLWKMLTVIKITTTLYLRKT